MKIGKHETQIIKRLKYHLHIGEWHKLPKCCWYFPREGWICDPKEIECAMRLDDAFVLSKEQEK